MIRQLNIESIEANVEASSVGQKIHELIAELYPFCRSLTGDGVRETLAVLGGHISLSISEVPTGTQVFDWTVPKEWNIRDAYVKDSMGRRVIDFRVELARSEL